MQEEDEISLIDLFVVVLKHRWLIISTTALAGVIAAITLFGLPRLGVLSVGSYTIQATAVSSQLPPVLDEQIGINVASLAVSYAQDIDAVVGAVIRNKLGNPDAGDSESWRFRTYIARSFIGNVYKVTSKAGVVTFELSSADPEKGKAFITEMIGYAEREARADIASRSTLIASSMESLYMGVEGNTSSLAESIKQLIIASRIYSSGDTPVLTVTSEPEIFVDAQGRGSKAVLLVMAVFLVTIIAAFILEYVDRIKSDPEAMAKINQALGKKRP